MTGFDSFTNAGVAAIQVGIVNVDGCPMGVTGTLSADDSVTLKLMHFAKRFGGAAPQPVRATAIGDNNRSRHEYLFNPPQMGELPFLFGSMDLEAYGGFTKTKEITDGNGKSVLLQSNAPVNAAQAVVVVTSDAQDADAGAFGLKRYINEIYSLVTIAPLLANLQEVQPAEWGYYGVPTQAGKRPWGVPFDIDDDGATRAGGVLLTSDQPIVMDTFLAGAGSPTTFDLAYVPTSEDTIFAFLFSSDGTPVSVTLTPPKTLVFAPLSEGDLLVVRYESADLLKSL